jgi:hypothetical protein
MQNEESSDILASNNQSSVDAVHQNNLQGQDSIDESTDNILQFKKQNSRK